MLEVITAQLREKAITIKIGTLVEATIIASASKDDDEGRWVKHKGKPAIRGFKAHIGADAGTALVEKIAVTPANVNDGRAGGAVIPDDPGEVFADSACRGTYLGPFRNPRQIAVDLSRWVEWRRGCIKLGYRII